ncbi:MAG: hypothetical protein MI750_12475 [Xanthomonadales bacterium]|nr:hypothetical protein [Xanthomonadales bacterium]
MILDPRKNLPGMILLGAAAFFGALGLLLPLVLSVNRGAVGSDDELAPIPDIPPAVALTSSEAGFSNAILSQPIFYDNRQLPEIEEEPEESDTPEDLQVSELDAAVTGVIITPEAKLAMVRVPGDNSSLIVREGMALEGELAAWKVGEIKAREVSFAASNGKVAKLELELNERALAAPKAAAPKPRKRPSDAKKPAATSANNANNAKSSDDQNDRQASLAEEVRRRIAERRAQLRAQRQQQLDQQNEDENE